MTVALVAVMVALAAGVLAPKVVPALLPVRGLPPWTQRGLAALGPATMGALAAVTALSAQTAHERIDFAVPAAVAALVTAVTGRPLPAMAVGFISALGFAWLYPG